ncbi:MAG: hypothetical protein JOZ99_08265 [Actinobacteria bacterium]|nr:hypothetical protein [Actinomycetota bacterium]
MATAIDMVRAASAAPDAGEMTSATAAFAPSLVYRLHGGHPLAGEFDGKSTALGALARLAQAGASSCTTGAAANVDIVVVDAVVVGTEVNIAGRTVARAVLSRRELSLSYPGNLVSQDRQARRSATHASFVTPSSGSGLARSFACRDDVEAHFTRQAQPGHPRFFRVADCARPPFWFSSRSFARQ